MEHLIKLLKNLREQERVAKEMVETSRKLLEKTEEWSKLQLAEAGVTDTQAKIKQVDEQIREAALLEFASTGNKKPYSGVSVVINKVLKYSPERATRWAVHNAFEMVKLDTRAFEKHARAVLDTVPIDFVQVSEQPSVRISKDL